MPYNPKSAENLQMWGPGESGNPAGRPNAGAAVKEWYNQLCGKSRDDLEAIVDDPTSSVAKIAAARQWLNTINGDMGGALPSLVEVCDRTGGQSVKTSVNINTNEPRTEPERAAERDRILARIRSRIARPA